MHILISVHEQGKTYCFTTFFSHLVLYVGHHFMLVYTGLCHSTDGYPVFYYCKQCISIFEQVSLSTSMTVSVGQLLGRISGSNIHIL